jgi:hypothetical protein
MNARSRVSFGIAALILGVLSCRPAPAQAQATRAPADYDPHFNYDCDRACLNAFIDEFLAALVAHDPSRLPLGKEVKYTENGQALRLGDGFWGTASALPNYKIYADDPQAGQAMFMGVMQENGAPVIFCARLKVELHQITEIEAIVARKEAGSIARPENLVTPNPILSEMVPPAQRRSRQNMIAIANSYFNAIEKGHASYVPFDSNCNRIESGVQTTNNSQLATQPGSVLGMGCADQIKTRNFQPDTLIRDRRFAVIDEERGLVFVLGFFDHDATLRSYTLADGRTVKQTRTAPWTWEIAEMFKIQDGKILRVEALVNTGIYGMKAGW